jgi:hypothetical protein
MPPLSIRILSHGLVDFDDSILEPIILPPEMVAVEMIFPANSPPLAYTLPRNNASPVLALSSKVAFQLLYAKSPFLDMYTPE